jgi:SAM-dependent methyltransferase
MKFIYFVYPLSFDSLEHLVKQTFIGKSPSRLIHNFFLRKLRIKGLTIDIGSKKYNSYLNFIKKKECNFFFADKKKKKLKNYFDLDLEKKLVLKKKFDTVILFNVLEHIENYKNLLVEIYKLLNKNGTLQLYTPFMHRYHQDPYDIFRPTHYYLGKILKKIGFRADIYLIGVGPLVTVLEIINQYLKFKFIKIIIFIFFIFIDKIILLLSKDSKTYYLGVHCICKKN